MNEYVQSEALPQICVFGLNQMMQWKKKQMMVLTYRKTWKSKLLRSYASFKCIKNNLERNAGQKDKTSKYVTRMTHKH